MAVTLDGLLTLKHLNSHSKKKDKRMNTPITPQQLYGPATSMELVDVLFGFGPEDKYCTVRVALNDDKGNALKYIAVPMSESELATWGDNDEVLLQLVSAKLGYI